MSSNVEAAASPRGPFGKRGDGGLPPPGERADAGSDGRQTSTSKRCVLLIEDDARLLRALARVLEFDGFRVLLAADARSARAAAREHGGEVGLIVTDIILPDASAIEVARELASACAGAPILFMSGSPTQGGSLPALGVPTAFLPKPFSPLDLKAALRALKVF
ncbi:MAG TPA: response regulator [Polyangiales bacterium]|nr:response regulator [Polyangiales bacterium]